MVHKLYIFMLKGIIRIRLSPHPLAIRLFFVHFLKNSYSFRLAPISLDTKLDQMKMCVKTDDQSGISWQSKFLALSFSEQLPD